MWEWISDNWSIITTVVGVIVAALKSLGKSRYARIIEKIVEAIEEEKDTTMLKKSIKVKTKASKDLHAIVQRVTSAKHAKNGGG